jgi:LmbE family N-acetylglucosaminyl deacetylase
MRTDSGAPIALFLFAHQDDEFGVFFQLERERQAGRRVCCVYVTDGSATADPDRRNVESRGVLQRLGVATDDILFVGQELGIGDGVLHSRVEVLAKWLTAFFDAHGTIEACFVPAWEGGHPDHDLLHAITVRLLAARGHLEGVRQYPLYHGKGCHGPLFRALSPLTENGSVERQVFGWRDRIRYVRLCLAYPSQWRSWIGLFPLVGWRYLRDGAQQLQRVNSTRLVTPPHAGRLYYERRGFLDWPTLRAALDRLPAIH